MKSSDVKKILVQRFGLPVRVRTIPGALNLIEAWVPWAARFSETEFPLALRLFSLRTEYGFNADWMDRGVAGNTGLHGIALTATNWARVLNQSIKL